MYEIDKKSLYRLLFIVICCLLFVICLPFVYRSVPKSNIQNEHLLNTEVNQDYTSDTEDETTSIEQNQNSQNDNSKDSLSEFETTEDDTDEIQPESSQDDIFEKAINLRANKKYESAVYEYEQAANSSDDPEYKAKCYEEIAKTYASIKRYGSALSFAQKAFNSAPNTEREVLLARLYYKTGSTDKAKDRINAILNRDFADE